MSGLSDRLPNLSGAAWKSIALRSAILTLAITSFSVIGTMGIMMLVEGHLDTRGLITATVMPLLLVPPSTIIVGAKKHQLRAANEDLWRLAHTDTMLECMNRRGLITRAEAELKGASPANPCALLIIDADNFKNINDLFGHSAGDTALEIIAQTIQSVIRFNDNFGRIGGEEFAVILPDTDEDQARTIAKRICQAVSESNFAPEGETHTLTVSVGGAVASEVVEFLPLYDAADRQLYAAKDAGRNRTEFEESQAPKRSQKTRRTDAAA